MKVVGIFGRLSVLVSPEIAEIVSDFPTQPLSLVMNGLKIEMHGVPLF